MAPPKDIARSYPKRGLTADVGFRSEPKFCGDGSISLDGTSDYLESTLTTALGSGFSVSLWFLKRTTTGSNNYLWASGSSGPGSFISLSCTSANRLAAYDQSLFLTSSLEANLNQWHHAVLTVGTGANSYTVYLDGIGDSLANTASPNITNGDFEIGRYSLGSTHYHDGLVSDVRIYDQVLTQDQVREIYNNPGLTIPTGLSASNLRHRYKLETDYVDTGASGDDLTAFGSPSFTVNRPQLPRGLDLARGAAMARVYSGRAVDFDGSADRLTAAHYNPSGDYLTTTAWINADTLRNQGVIFNGTTGRNSFLFYMLASGVLRFYWNDTTGDAAIPHQTALTVGQWYHVAAVMDMSDPADHQITFYINGIATTNIREARTFTGSANYGIGNEYSATGFFDGKIADCRIYDVALTQAQVRELYHNPEQVLPTGVSASNLRRYYPLSDYNDATAGGMGGRYFQDMGADGEPAEDKGSSSMNFAQPVPCPQLGLQQSASRIYWDDNTAEKLSATIPALGTDFTIAFWWFSGSSADADVFLEANTPGLYQLYDDGTQIIYYSTTAGVQYSGASVPEGEWTHIGLTPSGIYKNGVLFPKSGTPVDWLGTAYRIFGRHSASLPCNGTCSNMAFWSDALTTAEMLELYNQGPDYDPRNDTGNYASSDTLQNLWFMDDLTTVKDRKGSNDLTVIGSPIMQSFPENASGSTIVGDFTLKRRGVSVLNKTEDDNDVLAIIPASADVFPTSQGFTCSVWLRGGQEASRNAYIVATTNRTAAQRFGIYTQSGASYWGLEMPVSASPTTADAAITYDPNEWACLSFTLDFGTNTVKMYTNGALQTTVTRSLVVPTTFSDINVGGSGAAHPSITGTTPVALFKVAQRTWSDDEVQRNYYSDLRLIKGLANE